MLSIRPGFTAKAVLEYLNHARSEMASVRNVSPYRPEEALNAYNRWVTRQIRTLGSALSAREMSNLITTPRYWSLQSVDPNAYGEPLIAVIDQELTERREALDYAFEELRRDTESWGDRETAMAVLDTNVLLRHHRELTTFPWHSYLNIQTDLRVVVWIPLAVVDELDRLKSDRGEMMIANQKVPRRTLARQALRDLNNLFKDSLRTEKLMSDGPFDIRLMPDDIREARPASVDAEIIDRALDLTAYALKVVLFTYDQGMVFRARTLDLSAVKLEESSPEEAEMGPFPVRPPRSES